jgi:hypothetical protein
MESSEDRRQTMTPETQKAMDCLHAHADDCECRKILATALREALKENEGLKKNTWEKDYHYQVQRMGEDRQAFTVALGNLVAKTERLEAEMEAAKKAMQDIEATDYDDGGGAIPEGEAWRLLAAERRGIAVDFLSPSTVESTKAEGGAK